MVFSLLFPLIVAVTGEPTRFDSYKYDNIGDHTYPDQPVDVTHTWPGIPAGATATRVPFSSSGMLMFTTGNQYWLYDPDLQRVRNGYPLTITTPSVDQCHTWNEVSSYIGTLMDRVSGPSLTYAADISCSWTILAPWNATHNDNFNGLQLMFSIFDLSGNVGDTLEIIENRERLTSGSITTGFQSTSPLSIYTFSSSSAPPINQTLHFSSYSHSLTIKFTTKSPQAAAGATSRGWRVHWTVATPTVTHVTNLTCSSWMTSMYNASTQLLTFTPTSQTNTPVWVNINVIATPYLNSTWDLVNIRVYQGATYSRPWTHYVFTNGTYTSTQTFPGAWNISTPMIEDPVLLANCTGTQLIDEDCVVSVDVVTTNVDGPVPTQVQIMMDAPKDISIAAAVFYLAATTCNGLQVITDADGNITDGSGELPYFPGQTCTWLINATLLDALSIRIDIMDIDIEAGADYLYIYDGSDDSPGTPVLKQESGLVQDMIRLTTSSAYAFIKLTATKIPSKTRKRGQGFHLVYTAIARPEPSRSSFVGPTIVELSNSGSTTTHGIILEANQLQTLKLSAEDSIGRAIADEFFVDSAFHFNLNITSIVANGYNDTKYYTYSLDSTALSSMLNFIAPSRSGDYNFTVSLVTNKIASTPIHNGSLILRVVAAEPTGDNSYLTGLVPVVVAGQETNFSVQLVDIYSNHLLIGGQDASTVRVFVIVEGLPIHVPATLHDQYNGQHLVTFLPTINAVYLAVVLVAGQEVLNSDSNTLKVVPSTLSGTKSELSSPLIGTTLNVSQPIVIDLTARDEYENIRDSNESDWTIIVRQISLIETVLLSSSSIDTLGLPLTPELIHEGTNTQWQVSLATPMQLLIIIRSKDTGGHIKNSPCLVQVGKFAPSDATATTGLMAGLGVIVVLLVIATIAGFIGTTPPLLPSPSPSRCRCLICVTLCLNIT
jgi:hypothetical protein